MAIVKSPASTTLFASFKGWAFWGLAALFYAYEFLHRVAPSVLTGELRRAFSVDAYQLANISAMYFYAYALFQLPAGMIIDKFGPKRLLVMACAVLTLGSFLFTTTASSTIAHLSRFLIGLGSAFAFIGCLKIGAQWLSHRSFSLVVGLTNLCGTLGALSAGAPLAYFIHQLGWRETLMRISFGGLLITLLLWIFLQEKKDPHIPSTSPPLLKGFLFIIRLKETWLIALYAALLVAPIVALPELWADEYLKSAYQIPLTQAAAITHTIFIGTALGGPLIGWAIQYFPRKIRFMRWATCGALLLLSLFLYYPDLARLHLFGVLFSYGLLTANMLLCFSLITERFPSWAQGAAIGFVNMLIMGLGGLMQALIGRTLTLLRSSADTDFLISDYQFAFSLLPLCLLLAILLTFFISPFRHPHKKQGR